MAMNHVQLQPGPSMAESMSRFRTCEQYEAALMASRESQGFACPSCGGAARTTFKRELRRYWQCGTCLRHCGATSCRVFESSKLPQTVWLLGKHLLTQAKNSVFALELIRHLGVCCRAAWLVKHKLMEALRLRDEARQLIGRVEIEDDYLGEQRTGGKAGRSSEIKLPFIATAQATETGDPHLACSSQRPFTDESVNEFMNTPLTLPLTVVSVGLGRYTGAAGGGALHERRITGGCKASFKVPQFRAVSTVLGNLKTAPTGTYRAIRSVEYAYRHLAEVQYRFNKRYHLRAILRQLVHAAADTLPLPQRQHRLAEVHRRSRASMTRRCRVANLRPHCSPAWRSTSCVLLP